MASPTARLPVDDGRAVLWLTLAVFLLTGGAVALATWGVVPDVALLAGVPALAAAMLVDTFLYNAFRIEVGDGFWVLCYAFLLVQSLLAAVVVTWLSSRWRSDDGHPASG